MGIVSLPTDSIPQAAFTQCLRELPNCVVLRNEEDLFGNLQRGGDVDLLVGDLELAERTLLRHLGRPVRIVRSSYVTGYSYDWGTIDLLPTLEWRGACYLRTEAVLESRRLSASGRSVPRIAHEALISWLASLLFGGFFKERYAPDIRKAVEIDGSTFRQILMEVAGKKWGGRLWQVAAGGCPAISAEWTRPLRQAVWRRAFWRSPARTIQRFFAYVISELRLRFRPAVPWMAILGPDGDGKSALANEIVHRFAACPYGAVKVVHWRPRLVAPAQGAQPVTDRRRGSIGSGLRLLVLAADWMAAYWTRLVHLRAKGYILTFDWTYFDLLVDHTRYRYRVGRRLARALCWLLPKPDLVFWLDSERDVLWDGKPEVPPSDLARQRHVLDTALLGELSGGRVLNGSLPLSVLVDDIQRAIRAWVLDRSAASLGGVQPPMIPASSASAEDSSGTTLLSRGDGAR